MSGRFNRSDWEVDPRPALGRPELEVGGGEDQLDRIRCEPVAEFALMPRARLNWSESLLGRRCSNLQVPEPRASGAVRSDGAVVECRARRYRHSSAVGVAVGIVSCRAQEGTV